MEPMTEQPAPTVIDLFSGCGGLSWGLGKIGFQQLAAIDNWSVALRTFKHNHPESLVIDDDIRDVSPELLLESIGKERGEVDLVAGGPPCQGFSKNVPASYRYLEDERNQLFREYMRFVEVILPKAVMMENVAELYNAYGGTVRDEIINWLHRLGYATDVRVVTASNYGVPQKRRRFILLASRTGYTPFIPTVVASPVSAWEAISDLPQLENGERFPTETNPNPPENEYQRWARSATDMVYNHESAPLRPKQLERYESLAPGEGIKNLPDHLRPKSGYSGAYGRLDFSNPAPTITRWVFHPGSGRYGHPREFRIITMREAARLQGFTDDFEFLGSKNEIAGQIGNAVPPRLVFELGDEIRRCCKPASQPSQSGSLEKSFAS